MGEDNYWSFLFKRSVIQGCQPSRMYLGVQQQHLFPIYFVQVYCLWHWYPSMQNPCSWSGFVVCGGSNHELFSDICIETARGNLHRFGREISANHQKSRARFPSRYPGWNRSYQTFSVYSQTHVSRALHHNRGSNIEYQEVRAHISPFFNPRVLSISMVRIGQWPLFWGTDRWVVSAWHNETKQSVVCVYRREGPLILSTSA